MVYKDITSPKILFNIGLANIGMLSIVQ